MKADQACIVIFREKTAFRRYMICLFHVLDRLGSLRVQPEVKKHCVILITRLFSRAITMSESRGHGYVRSHEPQPRVNHQS